MRPGMMSDDIHEDKDIHYSILDPTGNITALVESPIDISCQPEVAARIMVRHPRVEQVGFVRYYGDIRESEAAGSGEDPEVILTNRRDGIQAELRMAGGEFCGNASMSTAALYLIRHMQAGAKTGYHTADSAGPDKNLPVLVRLRVSGAKDIVEVNLQNGGQDNYYADILMPPALSIEDKDFSYGCLKGQLPLVRMGGISHIIVGTQSVFSGLLQDRKAAEEAVRKWCSELETEGLGLMFADYTGAGDWTQGHSREASVCKAGKNEAEKISLVPLVYIPAGDTIFWENSCASGSCAVGMYLTKKRQLAVDITLDEPGGCLHVKSDIQTGSIHLGGRVRLLEDRKMSVF